MEKDCWFREKPMCLNCLKFLYKEKNCRFNIKYQTNYSKNKEANGELFYVGQPISEMKKDKWFIDNNCNNHMISDGSTFCDIDIPMKLQVILGNEALVEAKGKCTIIMETKKGTKFIQNVLLVPNLKKNLLNVS